MLIRRNPCYRPTFVRDRHGLLLVTKRIILATGAYALTWAA